MATSITGIEPVGGSSKPLPLSQTPGALEVRRVNYTGEEVGRGVFTLVDITRGTLVEDAHAIHIPASEYSDHISKTVLEHYVYGGLRGHAAYVALGWGSLFNHSRTPNIDFRVLAEEQRIEYRAADLIPAGSELFIFYGDHVPWEAEERAKRQKELEKEQGEFGDFDLS